MLIHGVRWVECVKREIIMSTDLVFDKKGLDVNFESKNGGGPEVRI